MCGWLQGRKSYATWIYYIRDQADMCVYTIYYAFSTVVLQDMHISGLQGTEHE